MSSIQCQLRFIFLLFIIYYLLYIIKLLLSNLSNFVLNKTKHRYIPARRSASFILLIIQILIVYNLINSFN